jgi:hypothetical protein
MNIDKVLDIIIFDENTNLANKSNMSTILFIKLTDHYTIEEIVMNLHKRMKINKTYCQIEVCCIKKNEFKIEIWSTNYYRSYSNGSLIIGDVHYMEEYISKHHIHCRKSLMVKNRKNPKLSKTKLESMCKTIKETVNMIKETYNQ